MNAAATLEFSINPQSAYKLIVQPQFSDLTTNTLNYFTSDGYDDVVNKRTIIDLRHLGNITHRRDASCDIIYNKLMNASTRVVTVGEAYAATKLCQNGLYQGALKDVRNGDPIFKKRVTPYFKAAVGQDMATNAWFGDMRRFVSATALYSTNIFNGVFYYIKKYIAAGIIPSSGAGQQAFTITDGTDFSAAGGPQAAYDLIEKMYGAQNPMMYNMSDDDKVFYVSKEIKKAYESYLKTVGINARGSIDIQNGIKNVYYDGIPIVEMPIWTTVITEIKGARGYAAILTLRGNFVFAFNKNYGEGPDLLDPFQVFYDMLSMQWYWRYFYAAGTQVALPEHLIVAMSTWN